MISFWRFCVTYDLLIVCMGECNNVRFILFFCVITFGRWFICRIFVVFEVGFVVVGSLLRTIIIAWSLVGFGNVCVCEIDFRMMILIVRVL